MFFRRNDYAPIPGDDLPEMYISCLSRIKEHKRVVISQAVMFYHAARNAGADDVFLQDLENKIHAFNFNRIDKIDPVDEQETENSFTKIQEAQLLMALQVKTPVIENEARQTFEKERHQALVSCCACSPESVLSNTSCSLSVGLFLFGLFSSSQIASGAYCASFWCCSFSVWVNQQINREISDEAALLCPSAPYFEPNKLEGLFLPKANASIIGDVSEETRCTLRTG